MNLSSTLPTAAALALLATGCINERAPQRDVDTDTSADTGDDITVDTDTGTYNVSSDGHNMWYVNAGTVYWCESDGDIQWDVDDNGDDENDVFDVGYGHGGNADWSDLTHRAHNLSAAGSSWYCSEQTEGIHRMNMTRAGKDAGDNSYNNWGVIEVDYRYAWPNPDGSFAYCFLVSGQTLSEGNCLNTYGDDEEGYFSDDTGTASDTDSDGDGLSNDEEENLGTNAYDSDTDGDGYDDGDEVDDGTDPLDSEDPGDGDTGSGGSSGTGSCDVRISVDGDSSIEGDSTYTAEVYLLPLDSSGGVIDSTYWPSGDWSSQSASSLNQALSFSDGGTDTDTFTFDGNVSQVKLNGGVWNGSSFLRWLVGSYSDTVGASFTVEVSCDGGAYNTLSCGMSGNDYLCR